MNTDTANLSLFLQSGLSIFGFLFLIILFF
jgi:hypothetical protein